MLVAALLNWLWCRRRSSSAPALPLHAQRTGRPGVELPHRKRCAHIAKLEVGGEQGRRMAVGRHVRRARYRRREGTCSWCTPVRTGSLAWGAAAWYSWGTVCMVCTPKSGANHLRSMLRSSEENVHMCSLVLVCSMQGASSQEGSLYGHLN